MKGPHLIAAIGDIKRFASARKLGGLV